MNEAPEEEEHGGGTVNTSGESVWWDQYVVWVAGGVALFVVILIAVTCFFCVKAKNAWKRANSLAGKNAWQ